MSADWTPAFEIAEAVRAGHRSAREVAEEALARVGALNPKLNAFVYLDADGARAAAAAIDEQVARGQDPGPLAGVPIGVKDLEDVRGLPTTYGSRAYGDNVATRDSVQVARLRAAGVVILGKTNTPEFGYKGFTENRLFGPTRNPWNTERTPGGSSGGSAAAVAGGLVPLCTGSDGGGSVRIPAGFCGCYGIKPTAGRIPLAGDTYPTWSTHSTYGPLARTVRDAARYLDVAAGPHVNDLISLDAPAGGYEAAVVGPAPRLRRVAWSADLGYAAVEPEVAQLAEKAARRLAEAVGAEFVEAHPGFDDPLIPWATIGAPGDTVLIDSLPEERRALLEPGFLRFAETGRAVTGAQYHEALQARHLLNRCVNAFFEDHDLLLTPTLAATAFRAEGPPPQVIAGREVGPAGFLPFTYPFNMTGHPAASVPAGRAANGLPVGLQVVGPRFADALVLAASAAYEAAGAWEWPGLS